MRRGVLGVVVAVLISGWGAEAEAKCRFPQPVELAAEGEGWKIPRTWARRGLNFGTPSMIALIQRTAKKVAIAHPGTKLLVADISRKKGGTSPWHKSHTCGCDVDLLLFATGADGRPIKAPKTMIPFNARGVGTYNGKPVKFDTARNWTLVKALLQDRIRVERVFIHAALKRRLLAHAKRHDESAALIERADARMTQPSDAGLHDDHLHVRIVASRKDLVARADKPEPKLAPPAATLPSKRKIARAPVKPRAPKQAK